jgi:ribosomal protein S12 methylthiotransferase
VPQTYWVETLGCPKNQVDSDKLVGKFQHDGLVAADGPENADVVVVNTCAFIGLAREESIETVLSLSEIKKSDSRLVVTGCMAERYGDELQAALPEVQQVAGFGVPIELSARRKSLPQLDLLNMPRPRSNSPWAYVKVAEGCDRNCGFCAIPSFRGKQNSRDEAAILEEVDQLQAREIVLIAQDLASYGKDRNRRGAIVPLVKSVTERVDRVRLLYLYPSDLSDELIDVILATGVPYFDLSLQHVSKPLLRRMRRWGDGERFLKRVNDIRSLEPNAAFRSNFIVGYPGETEEDHDRLLAFVEEADMEWCSFFEYSPEDGTYATTLDNPVPEELMKERVRELRDLQDSITARKRAELIGENVEVLIDEPGVGRSHLEAPEIDGVIEVPAHLPVGTFQKLVITGAAGPDLEAQAVQSAVSSAL